MKASFKSSERLKSRKAIDDLFRKGDSFAQDGIRVVFLFFAEKGDQNRSSVQVAFSIPKKRCKKAVERNRAKRLMREGYRKNKRILSEVLEQRGECCDMMLIHTGKGPMTQETVEGKIILILRRMVEERLKAGRR